MGPVADAVSVLIARTVSTAGIGRAEERAIREVIVVLADARTGLSVAGSVGAASDVGVAEDGTVERVEASIANARLGEVLTVSVSTAVNVAERKRSRGS